MDKKLYKMMDWPEIEALVYGEEDRPHELLGGHFVKDGILIQAFFPNVKKVSALVQIGRSINEYDMELMDEAGFYAVLIRRDKKQRFNYCFRVTRDDDTTEEIYDPYSFSPVISQRDIESFENGVNYRIYRILGAHVREIDGIKGTSFAVWAPNAVRVSVVGDFNGWDGRVHQMRRMGDSGIFELFIPGIKDGDEYKYELRLKGRTVKIKKDPYAFESGKGAEGASVVYESSFKFDDEVWMKERSGSDSLKGALPGGKKKKEKTAASGRPLSIYEMDLNTFFLTGGCERNYRELADQAADYIKEMGYTHVELMPVMEHLQGADAYEISSIYAPQSALGRPDDLKYLIDLFHREGIGVILDWVGGYFTAESEGLSEFDGTCLYGHLDMRQRYNGKRGTLNYNYARPQVACYLTGNALYWLEEFHADGLKIDSLDEMIYLDYYKEPGQWLPNRLGGKENLDAIDFLKKLNSVHASLKDGSVIIADGLKTWGKVTASQKEDGLGFDYKLDKGFTGDFIEFLSFDPFFRTHHYGELIFSLSYYTSERFILPFSRRDVESEEGISSLLLKMPGGMPNKFANLRAAFGFLMTHPGKSLCFMGQDMGAESVWDGKTPLDASILKPEENQKFNLYIKDLMHFYREHPALFERDCEEDGFEWVNNTAANDNVIVFLRRSANEELLVVLNFANILFSDYRIGVPKEGKYKEIFNSDAAKYGGGGNVNPRVKTSKKERCDGRDHSIKIKAAPLSVTIFTCG